MIAPDLKGGRCQCGACGQFFSSVREFDRHRVGSYGEHAHDPGTRRCLTVAELDARGWRIDARGFRMQSRPQRAPAGEQALRVTRPATGVPEAGREA